MIKPVEKLQMLNAYLAKYYSIDSIASRELGLGQEFVNVLSFHAEEEWRHLDDQGKVELFKASLSLNRKTGPDGDYSYAINLISFFDELLLALNKVNQLAACYPEISNIDFDVLRIYAVLNIEKNNFDEICPPRSHLKPCFFENLATQFSSKYPDLNLGLLAVLHRAMYDFWSDKPVQAENESI
jgi:hypothetical protein